MNQLFKQLTTKPLTEIHHTPFAGTAAENILDWLDSFNWTATHNVWNDQKQLQVIPVYLKDTALNFNAPCRTKLKLRLTFQRMLYDKAATQMAVFMICMSSYTN